MAVDREILDKARETVVERLKVEIQKRLRRKVSNYSDDCLEIFYEGTARPLATTSVEWDWIDESGGIGGHIYDLETDEFVKDWVIRLPETTVLSTKIQLCHAPVDDANTEDFQIVMEYAEDNVLFQHFTHGNHQDTLQAKTKCTVSVNVQVTVTVRRWTCYSAMVPGTGGDQFAIVRPIDTVPDDVVSTVAVLIRDVLPPLTASLNRHARDVIGLSKYVEKRAESEEALRSLTRGVATRLEPRLDDVFKDVTVHLFPPSVEFGQGEGRVTVSPTVGGSDSPGASVNAGVQVDINREGEGRRPVGRVTLGVDLDQNGKAVGASFGWRCRF